MRNSSILGSFLAITAATTLAVTVTAWPAPGLAASSGSGADNARVIGTLTINGLANTAIPVRSYSWAMQTPVDPSSASPIGATQWSEVSITKSVDSVSPQLFLAAVRGTRFTNAVLVVYRPGTTELLARYTFNDVLLTANSSNDLGRSNGFPIEGLNLVWRRITVQFGTGAPVCFDRSTRTGC